MLYIKAGAATMVHAPAGVAGVAGAVGVWSIQTTLVR